MFFHVIKKQPTVLPKFGSCALPTGQTGSVLLCGALHARAGPSSEWPALRSLLLSLLPTKKEKETETPFPSCSQRSTARSREGTSTSEVCPGEGHPERGGLCWWGGQGMWCPRCYPTRGGVLAPTRGQPRRGHGPCGAAWSPPAGEPPSG